MTSPAQTYHEYLVPAIFARWAPAMLEYARPQPGGRVLDIACGTGIIARTVAPAVGKDGAVLALDVNAEMLEVARNQPAAEGAAIEWLERSAQSLPDGDFDLIVCQQGLQFFPDPEGAVGEMRRVMRDGGRAVVSVWQDIDVQPVFGALMKAEARYLGVPLADVGVPFMFERRHALQPLFQAAGFREVTVHREVREAVLPEPDRFLQLALMAGAAVIPELAAMDDAQRAALVAGVRDEVAPVLERHTRDGKLVFPMHNSTVVARA
jgi:SAM-dependent methyltransferase